MVKSKIEGDNAVPMDVDRYVYSLFYTLHML